MTEIFARAYLALAAGANGQISGLPTSAGKKDAGLGIPGGRVITGSIDDMGNESDTISPSAVDNQGITQR